MKLAWCLIVKGDGSEDAVLDRALENLHPHVDKFFVTVTHGRDAVPATSTLDVVRKWGGEASTFEWVHDFSKARNFNFSQVPKEYDYIGWSDSDDVWRNAEKLKPTILENPSVDVFGFWYLYQFNEHKQPVVAHKKSQIVRNDGCVTWKGELHEDLQENRQCVSKLVTGIDRMHFTTEERVDVAKERNVDISYRAWKAHPDDPRYYWNYGQSLFGMGKFGQARKVFEDFLEKSGADEEKYVVLMRLADIAKADDRKSEAVDRLRYAIGMKIEFPDAYLEMGKLMFEMKKYDDAERYIIEGLQRKPPQHQMVVFNPRDYDYNPLMLLAKVYYQKARPDLMVPCLEGCLKIQPDDETVKGYLKEAVAARDQLEKMLKRIEEMRKITDREQLKKELDRLPKEMRSHPGVCAIRNAMFFNDKSSGKDIVYYCGNTQFQFNPALFKTKGFGGSEEAVVNLTNQFAKAGWNVKVYANCGDQPETYNGVEWLPFWMYNPRDAVDVTILWRHPKIADYNPNTKALIVDLHDVIPPGEFTTERLEKITSIFVKTKFHRSLYPLVPDDKFTIIPNGMDFALFDQKAKKDQYLLVNTSSPDRSLDVLPKLFKKVKEKVPQARCKWAYGWEIYDINYAGDKEKEAWKQKVVKEMAEAGVEDCGRLQQKDAARLYLEANILAYPTEFAEIDCITVKKAQACGALPITTDFGALNESVQYGVKIHSKKTKDTWSLPYQFTFGLEDEKAQQEWVDAVVAHLKAPLDNRKVMKEWSRQFAWPNIAEQWNSRMQTLLSTE